MAALDIKVAAQAARGYGAGGRGADALVWVRPDHTASPLGVDALLAVAVDGPTPTLNQPPSEVAIKLLRTVLCADGERPHLTSTERRREYLAQTLSWLQGEVAKRTVSSASVGAAWLSGQDYVIGVVGDGRVYLLSRGKLDRVRTVPVAHEQEDGDSTVVVEVAQGHLHPGDLLLVCAAELSRYIGYDELGELVKQTAPELERAAERMMHVAKNRGGGDQMAVALAQLPGVAAERGVGTRRKPNWAALGSLGGVLVLLLLGARALFSGRDTPAPPVTDSPPAPTQPTVVPPTVSTTPPAPTPAASVQANVSFRADGKVLLIESTKPGTTVTAAGSYRVTTGPDGWRVQLKNAATRQYVGVDAVGADGQVVASTPMLLPANQQLNGPVKPGTYRVMLGQRHKVHVATIVVPR